MRPCRSGAPEKWYCGIVVLRGSIATYEALQKWGALMFNVYLAHMTYMTKNLHHLDIWEPTLLATPRAQGTGDGIVKGGKGIGAHDYDDGDCEYDGDD